MREHVLVYDTGGGIKEVEVNQGIRRISGSNSLSTLESHLAEHAAILGTSYNLVSNEFIRVRDEGGGLREVPVTQGVRFIRSDSNKVTLDGHALEHAALAADTPLAVTSNEYVLVYNTGGGSRQVPVVDGCLFIEGERYLSTYSDHFNIHTTTGLPPGLDLPAIGRTLFAPLKSSLVLAEGTGSPTFTRATSAWVFDNEGKLNLNVPSGCARFTGARLVRNLLSASEDLNSASWTKTNLTVTSGQADPDGGTSAWKVEAASSAAITFYQTAPTGTNAKTYTYSFYVKKGSGALDANRFYLHDTIAAVNVLGVTINYDTGAITYFVGSTGVTVTSAQNGFWRVEMRADAVTQGNPLRCYTFFTGAVETGGEFAYFYHPQLENVSGQADQTASEYVSVGVLSAPFHGAGVDGCAWFPTNKDGSAISSSTLEGYISEPSRTNNCLRGRNLEPQTSSTASKPWVSSTVNPELVVNGNFGSDTAWTKGTGWSIGSSVATKTAGVGTSLSQDIGLISGKSYTLTFTVTRTAGTMFIRLGTVGVNLYEVPTTNGTYTVTVPSMGSNGFLYFFGDSSWAGTISNISVKESAIQATSTTGLDNVANSASRLTAAGNDATIMQLLTAATGTRTTSAFIKRISGTGTVSITRNGGTNWTDITSSLVTGSWVLVQMTSDVGANPTVGIKMGTSGDVIDVDCVQDENGAWATSPILTTTAAVTRNADVLTYQTASNWSDTAGTAFVEVAPLAYSGGAIGSATNGLLLSTSNSGATAYDGTNSANGPSGTPGSSEKLAFRWGSSAMTVSSGGVIGTPGTYDGGMGLSSIGIGSSAAGCFRNAAIYNYAMTDAELQAVTA